MTDYERGKVEAAQLIQRVLDGEVFGSGPQPQELLDVMQKLGKSRRSAYWRKLRKLRALLNAILR